jgi:hypothetical protein
MVLMQRGMKDKRYKKTEEKMLSVFFVYPDYTMRQLAKKAGVGRSTAYFHHSSVRRIVPDCEKYVLIEYRRVFKKDADIKKIFFDLLIFVLKNRKFFELFLKFNDREILIEMLSFLRPYFRGSEKCFRIYVAEVTEVVFEWGRGGFSEDKISGALSDIMYLTRTAYDRLSPVR